MNLHFLYVIKCERFYKVGMTKDLEKRLAMISTSSPFSLEISHVIEFSCREDARVAEQIAHATLSEAGMHTRMEWFQGDIERIISICHEAEQIAKKRGRIRCNEVAKKAIHLISIAKLDVISELTGIPQQRLLEIGTGAKIGASGIMKINTLWGAPQ